jgi:hypothetical protein
MQTEFSRANGILETSARTECGRPSHGNHQLTDSERTSQVALTFGRCSARGRAHSGNFRRAVAFVCLLFAIPLARAEEWPDALRQMPLPAHVTTLVATNCTATLLGAFQSNNVVKALVFMPGATDEFYMFHRARAVLTNAAPTLLDAIIALTNQTLIRATFRPPLLLLHTAEDPLEPQFAITDEPTAAKLRVKTFQSHTLFNDADWDTVMPVLEKKLKTSFRPDLNRRESWHFYRHSFAGWNLDGWETLLAVSLAGKETFTVEKKRVVFAGDERIRERPQL